MRMPHQRPLFAAEFPLLSALVCFQPDDRHPVIVVR
jgi:hypothetical protein